MQTRLRKGSWNKESRLEPLFRDLCRVENKLEKVRTEKNFLKNTIEEMIASAVR